MEYITKQKSEREMMTLQANLDAFKSDFEAGKAPYNVPPSVIETMHRATAELKASNQTAQAKKVGDRVSPFTLTDSEGKVIVSDSLLSKGPLIVSFYRGVWCPYCNMELQALQAALPLFEEFGAGLIAISPQSAPNSRKSVRENKLTFPILSDVKGDVGKSFGLMFRLPDYLIDLYKKLKIDLPTLNDDPSWTLPMPARYVIGRDGVIRYAEVNPDYTQRPEPEDLLPALEIAATTAG